MKKRDIERAQKRAERNLAEQVKARRGETGQREFARQTGFDQGQLSRIEARKVPGVTLATVTKLSVALGCDVAELLQPVEKAPKAEKAEA